MMPREESNWTVMTSSSSIIQSSHPSSVPFQTETRPTPSFHSSFVPYNYRANTMDKPSSATSMPSSVFRLPSAASSSLVHAQEGDSFALPNEGRLTNPFSHQEPLWKQHIPYQQQQQQQPQQQLVNRKRDKKLESAQLHFSYVSNRATPVSREELRNAFSHFGPVMEISVKKAQIKSVRYSVKSNYRIIKINFFFLFHNRSPKPKLVTVSFIFLSLQMEFQPRLKLSNIWKEWSWIQSNTAAA
jgi:hypothetical protein